MGAGHIVIERTLKAPPEVVFDAIATPDGLRASQGVRKVELLETGTPEPHGVGAVRLVDLGVVVFEERVDVFERPQRFEYLIRRARPPFTHHGGSLLVEPDGTGSRVRWTTTVSAGRPVLTRALAAALKVGLTRVLAGIDRRFTRGQ